MTTFADIDTKAREELTQGVAYAITENLYTDSHVAVATENLQIEWFASLSEMMNTTGITHVITFNTKEEFEAILP